MISYYATNLRGHNRILVLFSLRSVFGLFAVRAHIARGIYMSVPSCLLFHCLFMLVRCLILRKVHELQFRAKVLSSALFLYTLPDKRDIAAAIH